MKPPDFEICDLIFKSIFGLLDFSEKEYLDNWLKIENNRLLYNDIIDRDNIRSELTRMDEIRKGRDKVKAELDRMLMDRYGV